MRFTAVLAFLSVMAFGLSHALAQSPPPPAPTPETTEAIVDWRNLEGAVTRLIQANEAKAAELAALKVYWGQYVAGLSTRK